MVSDGVPGIVHTSFGKITLLRQLGKGKSGHSFLAALNGRSVVFKRMHNEPCAYYTFTDDKVQLEIRAYEKLSTIGIPMPELIGYDQEQQFIVKTYIDGHVGHEWIAQTDDDETIIERLFAMSAKLRSHNLNIDYFPANFVITGSQLYYVDYEINPYSYEWSLEQWGIYYWANHRGMAEYVRSGDWRGINESANSGIPIKAPFEAQVRRWRTMFQTVSHPGNLNA